MSTRLIATVRVNASYRHEIRQKLRLSVDPASELSHLNSILGSRQLTLPDLRRLISEPSASSVLSTLAPAEFSRVCARLEDGRRSALETTAADLQAELAETLMVATTVVAVATQGITVTAFAESGLELGYNVTTHQAESVTCVELRRGHELVLVVVHDDGSVEFDHGGLAGRACDEEHLQLQRAAERRGVFISPASLS
jgi:hypothetical protein